jgi:hypothetical protein
LFLYSFLNYTSLCQCIKTCVMWSVNLNQKPNKKKNFKLNFNETQDDETICSSDWGRRSQTIRRNRNRNRLKRFNFNKTTTGSSEWLKTHLKFNLNILNVIWICSTVFFLVFPIKNEILVKYWCFEMNVLRIKAIQFPVIKTLLI